MSSLSDAKYHAQRTATPRPNAKTIPDGILFGRTSFLALTARRHNGRTCSRRLIASAQRCCLYDILRTLNRCFEPQGGELMSAEHKKEYADCANCFFEVKPAECADKWHNEGNALNVRVPKVSSRERGCPFRGYGSGGNPQEGGQLILRCTRNISVLKNKKAAIAAFLFCVVLCSFICCPSRGFPRDGFCPIWFWAFQLRIR